jgi:hypothetical protein
MAENDVESLKLTKLFDLAHWTAYMGMTGILATILENIRALHGVITQDDALCARLAFFDFKQNLEKVALKLVVVDVEGKTAIESLEQAVISRYQEFVKLVQSFDCIFDSYGDSLTDNGITREKWIMARNRLVKGLLVSAVHMHLRIDPSHLESMIEEGEEYYFAPAGVTEANFSAAMKGIIEEFRPDPSLKTDVRLYDRLVNDYTLNIIKNIWLGTKKGKKVQLEAYAIFTCSQSMGIQGSVHTVRDFMRTVEPLVLGVPDLLMHFGSPGEAVVAAGSSSAARVSTPVRSAAGVVRTGLSGTSERPAINKRASSSVPGSGHGGQAASPAARLPAERPSPAMPGLQSLSEAAHRTAAGAELSQGPPYILDSKRSQQIIENTKKAAEEFKKANAEKDPLAKITGARKKDAEEKPRSPVSKGRRIIGDDSENEDEAKVRQSRRTQNTLPSQNIRSTRSSSSSSSSSSSTSSSSIDERGVTRRSARVNPQEVIDTKPQTPTPQKKNRNGGYLAFTKAVQVRDKDAFSPGLSSTAIQRRMSDRWHSLDSSERGKWSSDPDACYDAYLRLAPHVQSLAGPASPALEKVKTGGLTAPKSNESGQQPKMVDSDDDDSSVAHILRSKQDSDDDDPDSDSDDEMGKTQPQGPQFDHHLNQSLPRRSSQRVKNVVVAATSAAAPSPVRAAPKVLVHRNDSPARRAAPVAAVAGGSAGPRKRKQEVSEDVGEHGKKAASISSSSSTGTGTGTGTGSALGQARHVLLNHIPPSQPNANLKTASWQPHVAASTAGSHVVREARGGNVGGGITGPRTSAKRVDPMTSDEDEDDEVGSMEEETQIWPKNHKSSAMQRRAPQPPVITVPSPPRSTRSRGSRGQVTDPNYDHPKSGNLTGRRAWSIQETAAIVQGVRRHGRSNPKDILADPEFSEILKFRTNVSIKDRIRTMERNGDM